MEEVQTELQDIKAYLRRIQANEHQEPSAAPPSRDRQSTRRKTASKNTASKNTVSKSTASKNMAPVTRLESPSRESNRRPAQGQQFQELHPQADWATDWAESRQAVPQPTSLKPSSTSPSPRNAWNSQQLASEVQRLNHITSRYVQQLEAVPQTAKQPAPVAPLSHNRTQDLDHDLDSAFDQLEAKAAQVNQLSADQEAAILELKALADQIEYNWKLQDQESATRLGGNPVDLQAPPIWDYQEASVPHFEKDESGVFVLTKRAIDLHKAEREAALTAQALRHYKKRETRDHKSHRKNREGHTTLQHQLNRPNLFQQIEAWLTGKAEPTRSDRRRAQRRSKNAPFSIRQAVVLFAGAFVTRLMFDFVLAMFPGLWFPMMALIVTPGAIAVYRSRQTQDSGFIWGCRLVVIMLGLILGGRI